MADSSQALALLVFIGGLSAATGMVIVETIALATMVSNSLVDAAPAAPGRALAGGRTLGGLILGIRRATIVLVLLLGFVYFRLAGEALALVSIGLISFAAVAQFAPAILGGLFWKGATRRGAIAGLRGRLRVWAYTLPLPSLVHAGWLPACLLEPRVPSGLGILAPHALFGLTGLDSVSHSDDLEHAGQRRPAFVGPVAGGRARTPPSTSRRPMFVDVFRRPQRRRRARFWRGTATVGELQGLLGRFLGPRSRPGGADGVRGRAPAHGHLAGRRTRTPTWCTTSRPCSAGAVGTTSARFMVASVVDEEPLARPRGDGDPRRDVAGPGLQPRTGAQVAGAGGGDRASCARPTSGCRSSTGSRTTSSPRSRHELRTPLTSIRAFSEILLDNPDLDGQERERYLRIIVEETERLTRLINQVLDLSKLESGRLDWQIEPVDLRSVIATSAQTTAQLFRDQDVALDVELREARARWCRPTGTGWCRSWSTCCPTP